jgi:hypothetical protein
MAVVLPGGVLIGDSVVELNVIPSLSRNPRAKRSAALLPHRRYAQEWMLDAISLRFARGLFAAL